ncbi:hypothetical protein B0H67DRAFT_632981 [Lasiosphaeris hirsuta]|uniref:DUF7702 domain-containing protein n=1 Tax=Lasiosphaeris hirsuta TaxID=260670 RepID=A0AA40E1D6_9PEZI|nr:hypothetical protein B0H67DRAFT_632981 [Lasiosphaeris hirsuta]
MAVNPHTAAAIAQVAAYAPMAPITTYLMIRNWRWRPRTAWYPPAAFSAIRLAGGVLTIIEQQNQSNRTLIITTIVLLNIGLIPLLLTLLGYARLVLENNFGDYKRVKLFLLTLKISLLAAAGLLGAAGGYAGQPESANLQSTLSKAAYALFSLVLAALIASFIGLSLNQRGINPAHRLYVTWGLVSTLPLCVRAAYGIIGVAVASGTNMLTSTWSPLFGSATAFGLMGLLPEYIVLCIYVCLSTHHLRAAKREEVVERRTKHRSSDVS